MELVDLARWTPIGLSLAPPEPHIDWADLRGVRFAEPFFDQSVQRWAASPLARPLIRTGLAELAALDREPSLDPAGFIFHLSRCGSTLVSRLLSTLPGVVVASEPAPINDLLEADPARVHEAAQIEVLRLLIRALGRIRFGDETHYLVKLSSWNVRRLALFRHAFPAVPWIWVQRRPEAVMASILAGPPGWMQLRGEPGRVSTLFGLDPDLVAGLDVPSFCARILAAMLEAWLEAASPAALVLDYRDLPQAVWTEAAPRFGLKLEAGDVERMADEARYDAKNPARRVFAAAGTAIPDAIHTLAAKWVDPLYDGVADRARRARATAAPNR
jgi:hypothetical protein